MPSVEAIETLTPGEVSKILRLHPFTVRRLAKEGKLPAFKVGGVWRIRKDRFEAWLDGEQSQRSSSDTKRGNRGK